LFSRILAKSFKIQVEDYCIIDLLLIVTEISVYPRVHYGVHSTANWLNVITNILTKNLHPQPLIM